MRNIMIFFVFFCLAAAFAGCSDPSFLEGKYQSSPESETFIRLELKANGQGTWETDFDVVSFRWKLRGKEVWFHTQTGGVIVGDVLDNRHLRMEIPGIGRVIFEKNP